MLAVLVQTLPFFALIALGFGAAKRGFFGPEATAALTKFVFYFALSAMLLKFSARLDLATVFDAGFVLAYLSGTMAVYLLALVVALVRSRGLEEAAVEGQCAAIGNTGFLGVPMLTMLFGEAAIGPVMLVLAVDLIVFSSLLVILISARRDGRVRPAVLLTVGRGLIANPMIVSIALGLGWSATGWPLPGPVDATLGLLGAAATPGALFAIGASLASKSAERVSVAAWLSFAKLVLHPGAVAVAALFVFVVEPFAAGVMIAAAALPVAGNVYILAQHYGVAPQRVSSAILISTAASVVTVSAVIARVFAG
ncbi:MAG: malate transporter [Rhodobacterales bacterium CG2_30_65_12]|nr:MAG: malate transporter [Rhodobacterales bacterium CG2_30_65_12]